MGIVSPQASIKPYSGSCQTIDVLGIKAGMSKAETAGIAIGSIIGILLFIAIIAGIVWCCCCQLKR